MKVQLLSLFLFLSLSIGPASVAAQSFTKVSVGSQHICGINDNSDVVCTTSEAAKRFEPPANTPQMIDIAVGDAHACGIDLTGQAFCWSDANLSEGSLGFYDQLNIPAIDRPLMSISAGDNHTCAIDIDSRVWCWGLDDNLQTQPPGDGLGDNGIGFIKVEGGFNYSCGIQTDGDIACWTTDTSRLPDGLVSGPFTDLDLSSVTACGLRDDGSIECWMGRFDPPNNGPYSDLVVSSTSICGLNQNQNMDCTFNNQFANADDIATIPVDTQFVAIDSGYTAYRGTPFPFCGITTSGEIECVANLRQLPSPPGTVIANDLGSIDLTLIAERYSKDRIEIFWPINDRILMEVYRNDVLMDTTTNNRSWYDTNEQTQNPAVYKIRPTDNQGNVGEFSLPVSIDINTGAVTYADEPQSFPIVQPLLTVDSVRLNRVGNTYTVTWTGPTPADTDGLKGYEVRVNNVIVGFNDGFRVRLNSIDGTECNIVSVAAMSDQNTIIDYRAIVTNRFSRRGTNC